MQAAYARDPSSVPESWRSFFVELDDAPESAAKNADGASWKRADWPRAISDEQVAAFDGNWAMVEPKIEKKIKGAKPGASPEEIAQAVKGFYSCADDDPRLSYSRTFGSQTGPARP